MKVDAIQLFTKILDGKGPVQCCCGHIYRADIKDYCPACGRSSTNSEPTTIEAYKESRK